MAKEKKTAPLVGAHVSRSKFLLETKLYGAEAAQVSFGNTRSWTPPRPLTDSDLEFWSKVEMPVYIHASYLLNPASTRSEVREKTVSALAVQMSIAKQIGAKGVVIHGGHASGADLETACRNWRETLQQVELPVPLLIENTAGGSAAPGRSLSGLKMLWEQVGHHNVALCLDTCHAWAGDLVGENQPLKHAFLKLSEDLKVAGIQIGLLHLNGSADGKGSGRDRHANLTASGFPLSAARELLNTESVPGILETPGPATILMEELRELRK